MHIWYVKHYAGGPGFGKATRAYHLARNWQALGHGATVFVARFHHVLDRPEPLPPDATVGEVRYVSLPARSYTGNGFGRLLNMADFCRALYKLPNRDDLSKPDAIVISSPHPFAIVPGAWLAKRFGAKLAFEVRDLWPLSITELTGASDWHPFVVATAFTERYAYRRADLVASLLGGAEPYMREKGLAPGKFVHVPNGISPGGAITSTEPVSEAGRQAAAQIEAWHRDGRLVLIHPGAQGAPNALDRLIEALALLKRGDSAALGVLLLGEGEMTPDLKRQAAALGLDNVAFLPNVPKAEALWLTARSDAGYFGAAERPKLYRYGISPNKVFDYMQAGIPVVLAVATGHDPVRESGCGLIVENSAPQAIATALARLVATTPQERREIGERGRRAAASRYAYDTIARRFVEALETA